MTDKPRFHILDTLRGVCICIMIVYHGLWSLRSMFGQPLPWFTGWVPYLFQQFAASTFIILAGYCFNLGRNPRKRGLQVFGAGCLISAATLVFMPASAVIWGVLTLIGGGMLTLYWAEPVFKAWNPRVGFGVSLALFVLFRSVADGVLSLGSLWQMDLPQWLYANYITAFFGFPFTGFFSTDYFPFLSWFPLMACGYFLYHWPISLPTKDPSPLTRPLRWMGRHALPIYILHQPIICGVLWVFFWLKN